MAHEAEPRSLQFSMLPSEPDVLPRSMSHSGEMEQDREQRSESKLDYCETELDELDPLNRGLTDQWERVSDEVLDWLTQDHSYYSRDIEGQWNYENVIKYEGHEHDSSEKTDFVTADQASAGHDSFDFPGIFDYTEVVYKEENYENPDHHFHPIHFQSSTYSEDTTHERQYYMNGEIANFDYPNETENSLRWIASEDVPTERREHPQIPYTDNYVPTSEISLDHDYQTKRPNYGNANSNASNIDSLNWNFEAQSWNSLDTPLHLTTDQYDSCHSLMPESQIPYASGLVNHPGPSGMVTLENSDQGNLSEMEKDTRIRRRRKRAKMSAPSESVPNKQPETKVNQLQMIRESELLASYRPILPKLPDSQKLVDKRADDDTLNELRKRRRGWKCCSQTFDDYNFYKIHTESVHGHQDAPPAIQRPASQPTEQSSKPNPVSILCPFCLTNHDDLGTDVETKPRWNGLNYVVCPLCHRWYKSLRQLKIHFCAHFRVRVNETGQFPCRYCGRCFVLVTSLHRHEATCLAAHPAKQNSEEDGQMFKSKLTSAAEGASAVSAVSAATLGASTAAATAFTAVSAAATPKPAKSVPRNEHLFYCPDCGKLFAWESSVRRHQVTAHTAARKCSGRPRSSAKPRLSSTSTNTSFAPAAATADAM